MMRKSTLRPATPANLPRDANLYDQNESIDEVIPQRMKDEGTLNKQEAIRPVGPPQSLWNRCSPC